MKNKKLLILLALVSALVASVGCSKTAGPVHTTPKSGSFFGLVSHETGTYSNTSGNTLDFSTAELKPNSNFSGNKTSLLWGLITIKDY